MIVYHYDRITKEFLSSSEAKLDPLETGLQNKNMYLIPKYATTEGPPVVEVGEVAVFKNKKWLVKEDHRSKTVFDKATAESVVVNQIGPIESNFTLQVPEFPFPLWDGNKWKIDNDKKTKLINEEKIQKEVRKMAINSLIAKGELPIDYKDV